MVVKNVIDTINKTVKWVVIILFFLMVIAVFLQVIFRFIVDQPLAWTEELSRYLLIWLTFLGTGYGMSMKAHPSIEFLYEKVGNTMKKGFIILSTALILFFFWQIIVNSFEFIGRSMTQTSPVLQLPMGLVYTVIPISSVLFVINLLQVSVAEWRRGASQ
ncbi:TRAP transporter small permease [Cytobacillus sp.]|uniref:TRAP transporter small permease n=1 Tax=Cytobacillus sp. TaxID=2675269 RepID=UPI0028BDFC0C|nr:TRAP transporter small permease [Cytobacillus sp.]